jgi:creatinine amidohydrolase
MKKETQNVETYSLFKDTICDMTWLQVDEAARNGAVMLVPVGVIEQHGPHLPLATDIYGAYLLCSLTRADLQKQSIASVIAPPYYLGITEGTSMFPGSVNITEHSMVSVLTDLLVNYKRQGFDKQFIINHHGDPCHNKAMFKAILNSRQQDVQAVCVMRPATERAYEKASVKLPSSAIIRLTAEESDEKKQIRTRLDRSHLHIHAEERETSMVMRWYPALLKERDKIKDYKPVIPNAEEFEKAESGGKWRELSPLGYIGDPSVATEENGNLYAYEAEDIANAIAKYLR